MQLYNCKVRLDGSPMNEVRKYDVSAGEVMVMQAFHGTDAVVDIVKTKDEQRDDATERQRIFARYAARENYTPVELEKRVGVLRNLFGHDAMPMPAELPAPKVEEPDPAAAFVE